MLQWQNLEILNSNTHLLIKSQNSLHGKKTINGICSARSDGLNKTKEETEKHESDHDDDKKTNHFFRWQHFEYTNQFSQMMTHNILKIVRQQ